MKWELTHRFGKHLVQRYRQKDEVRTVRRLSLGIHALARFEREEVVHHRLHFQNLEKLLRSGPMDEW